MAAFLAGAFFFAAFLAGAFFLAAFLAGAFFFAAFLAGAFFLAAFLAGAFFFAVAKSLTSFQRYDNDDELNSCSSTDASRMCYPDAFTDFSVDST